MFYRYNLYLKVEKINIRRMGCYFDNKKIKKVLRKELFTFQMSEAAV
jgi:hypothetical protein